MADAPTDGEWITKKKGSQELKNMCFLGCQREVDRVYSSLVFQEQKADNFLLI